MTLTQTEIKMWEKSKKKDPTKMSDDEINRKYEKGEKRILAEIGREKLPSFAASLKESQYMEMNTRPFFQRRERWDETKKSLLIESFLMNIPIPPIILYEKDYNSYEVMDGQQRITAIQDFYDNTLILQNLEVWPELNGKTYNNLPKKIKAGIDRRSISTITLITESTDDPEEAFFLKQLAFERINTGGVNLSRQEVRNCLFYNKFNELLLELSANPIFAKAWGIPIDNEKERNTNTLYKKMEDAELVLRFFALRNIDNFRGQLENFLDLYMQKSANFSEEDIDLLRTIFLETINLASDIYNDNLFQPYGAKRDRAYKAYYDAVMVGFSNYLDQSDLLRQKKEQVIEETKQLLKNNPGLFTGQGKNKGDLEKRISLFQEMLKKIIEE
ncbi:DUF262 domain-containing protein [Cyanothece sp. BG0011]|uniref:DUF262 domain-containing protein n=1 Tax=Cyanothece sp. BG0011 TaxID=2082950 RepID=UPI000D1EFE20|nr:DUF262 domain-containing protein [Cyanothece sp. BG0011]